MSYCTSEWYGLAKQGNRSINYIGAERAKWLLLWPVRGAVVLNTDFNASGIEPELEDLKRAICSWRKAKVAK